MAAEPDVERAGARIEEILDGLRETADEGTVAEVEDLVRVLLDLYGAALARVVEIAGDGNILGRLTADPLLAALLVLHDLHPAGIGERIEQALEAVRPHLGLHAGGVEMLGVDDGGVVRLRLEGNCHHCPSSAETVRGAIEQAVLAAAPEVVAVQVEGVAEPTEGFVPLESVTLRCPTTLTAEAS
jgi:Fe-S cluster biogenesis protein NfuA